MENNLQTVFHVRENGNTHTFKLFLPGMHNVWNAMAAVLLARRMAIPFSVITEALASFPGVPGRLENYRHPNGALFCRATRT
jgi:UDP-N-acetylmuramate-alanine ligase